MTERIRTKDVVIGAHADYFNTGLWKIEEGICFAPPDLTIPQLKDFLLASGGFVFLHESGRLAWIR